LTAPRPFGLIPLRFDCSPAALAVSSPFSLLFTKNHPKSRKIEFSVPFFDFWDKKAAFLNDLVYISLNSAALCAQKFKNGTVECPEIKKWYKKLRYFGTDL
jgi:hypothetical protein